MIKISRQLAFRYLENILDKIDKTSSAHLQNINFHTILHTDTEKQHRKLYRYPHFKFTLFCIKAQGEGEGDLKVLLSEKMSIKLFLSQRSN